MGGGGGGVEERLNKLEKEKEGSEAYRGSGKARVSPCSVRPGQDY